MKKAVSSWLDNVNPWDSLTQSLPNICKVIIKLVCNVISVGQNFVRGINNYFRRGNISHGFEGYNLSSAFPNIFYI